jgi:NAD+ synthase (glutamine-hydrolysing)
MRNRVFTEKAAKHKIPLIVCNQVGGNTELIFEGSSMVIKPSGKIYDSLNSFEPDFRTYRLEEIIKSEPPQATSGDNRIKAIYDALVLGTRDYFSKMNFTSAILGLSGGIDSAVSLAIASEALGNNSIRVLLLPSMYSSQHSVDDAVAMADKLGVKYDIINIADTYYQTCKSLEDVFENNNEEDVTEENIQARLRAVFLMAVSNKFGNILLNTSNKSEAAVGYGTLYGDMAGGLSILGDVYKTDVYKLAGYINRNREIIPGNTISKPPSAELRPDQKDTDSLPDYNILDSILYQYIELQKPVIEITGPGINRELVLKVIRLINNNEYKRYQAPPILRISSKAFGLGRRMPLVARY